MKTLTTLGRRIFALLMLWLVGLAQVHAAVPAGISEYFIPVDEDNEWTILNVIGTPAIGEQSMRSIISVTPWADNTAIYYDHWEDGYDFDPNNPTTADMTCTANIGQIKTFESVVPRPRTIGSPAIPGRGAYNSTSGNCTGQTDPSNCTVNAGGNTNWCYDGRDRIVVVGGGSTVVRAGWPQDTGVVTGLAEEVYPVTPQLTTYILPFGEDLYAANNNHTDYRRVFVTIQATENTTFQVDFDHDGVFDALDCNYNGTTDGTQCSLNAGEVYRLSQTSDGTGGPFATLNSGTIIKGATTLQIQFLNGDSAENYNTRATSAFPRGFWDDEYYAPVPSGTTTGRDTDILLHNPNSTAITINWETRADSGSFTIDPYESVFFQEKTGSYVPSDSGVYLKGSQVFWGVSDVDNDSSTRDWAYSLVPAYLLDKEQFLSWSPGCWADTDTTTNFTCANTAGNRDDNGVFLTPAQDNTTIFVDLDNNGTVDYTYTLDRLEVQYVYDATDGDLTGAHIWATGPYVLAYGENLETSQTGSPSLDAGYTTLPNPGNWMDLALTVKKSTNPVALSTTANPATTTYTLTVQSHEFDIDSVRVNDTLAYDWTYTAGTDTTTITLPNGSTITGSSANPTVTAPGGTLPGGGTCSSTRGSCLTWSGTPAWSMAPNQTLTIVFTARTNGTPTCAAPSTACVNGDLSQNNVKVTATRTVSGIDQTFTASDFAFNTYLDNVASMTVTKTSSVAEATPVSPGDTFTYTVNVANPSSTASLTGVALYDALPPGVSYVAGTTNLSRSSVADAFDVAAYTTQDGTRNWVGNWIDSQDTSATAGDIQIVNSQLRLTGTRSIYRQVNLNGATTAVLALSYTTNGNVDNNDAAFVEVATSANGPWTTALTFTDDATGVLRYIIPSGLLGATTTIRLRTNNYSNSEPEYFFVNELSVTYDVSVTSGSPPNLLSTARLYTLAPGHTLMATFNVTVDKPFPTGLSEVLNTASATATEIPIPISDHARNIVVNPGSQSATVGDRVWLDANGNGQFDVGVEGEEGIGGVEVTLKDQYGTPIQTTTTNDLGLYTFTGVALGYGYYVEITNGLPAGLIQVPATGSNNRTNAFDLYTTTSLGNNRDNFDTAAYNNSNGTVSWSANLWTESGDNGNPASGNIQITGGELRITNQNGGQANSIARTLAIPSGATRAVLTFDYRSAGGLEPDDEIILEISNNNGSSYTTLATYVQSVSGSANFDISSYLAVGSTILRFRTNTQYLGNDEYFYVNNLNVAYTDSGEPRLTYLDADLGYKLATGTATIGDRVWSDADADQVQDPGEPGFVGVTVRLYRDTNGDSTINDPSAVDLISGSLDIDGNGSITSADRGGVVDNGGVHRAIINGKVDLNGDGSITATDDGSINLGGTTYTVTDGVLSGGSDPTPAIVNYRTAVTDAGGSYQFSVTASGTEDYIAYVDPNQTALSAYNLTTPAALSILNVASGGSYLNADFGIRQKTAGTTFSIKDRLWIDSNGDQQDDGETAGIAGVTVNLLDASGNVIATTTSAADGTFQFTGVPKDVRYSWRITDQNGVLGNYFGTTTSAQAGLFQMPGTLTGDLDYTFEPTEPHFGYNITRSIGDTVFYDLNGNGVQNTGETGMSGVVVKLYNDADGDGIIDSGFDTVRATLTTDANGNYLFSGLNNGGKYIVSIESPPSGFSYVQPGQPIDSDTGTAGQQRAASIGVSGESDLDNDFGYRANNGRTLSGRFWNDANNNGVDNSEPGLAGVTVELYNDANGNGVIDTGETRIGVATTDGNGNYSFAGVPGSGTQDYIVRVTDSSGVLSGYTTTYEKTEGAKVASYNGRESILNLNGDITNLNFGYYRPIYPTYAPISKLLAYAVGNDVIVEWRTAVESGTLGFFLERLDPETGLFVALHDELLPGFGTSPRGGSYWFLDTTAQPKQRYTYRLVEVEINNNRFEYGPFEVKVKDNGEQQIADWDTALQQTFWQNGFAQQRKEPSAQEVKDWNDKRDQRQAKHGVKPKKASKESDGQLRILVNAPGLYKLTVAEMANAFGLKTNKIENYLRKSKLALSNGGQPVAYAVAKDNSALYFYGQGLDTVYTDTNVYWLSVGDALLMATRNTTLPKPDSVARTFQFTQRWTKNLSADVLKKFIPALLLTGEPDGDYWYWAGVVAGGAAFESGSLDAPGAVSGGSAMVAVELRGASESTTPVLTPDHHVEVSVNGVVVGSGQFNGTDHYRLEARFNQGIAGAPTILPQGNTVSVRGLLDSGVPSSSFGVRSIELTYPRAYQAVNNALAFSTESYSAVTVEGFTKSDVTVLDISDARRPVTVAATVETAPAGGYRVAVAAQSTQNAYLATTLSAAKSPKELVLDNVSTLKDTKNAADYLVIAPDSLQGGAEALVALRDAKKMKALHVDLQDIYNAFNYGVEDAHAIKDFLAYAYGNWKKAPAYVALAGKGTIDPRNFWGFSTNVLPVLLVDTPYGMVASDNRYADVVGNDGVPEMAIGRIPALSDDELLAYADKLRNAEAAAVQPDAATWRNRAIMVADAPDDAAGNFPVNSDEVIKLLPSGMSVDTRYYNKKGQEDTYDQTFHNGLLSSISSGAGLVNYIGHGGITQLGKTGFFTQADAAALTNGSKLPIMAALTCAVGWDFYPGLDSLARTLTLSPRGGVIAGLVPSGLSNNDSAVELNKAFVTSVATLASPVRIGDAVLDALYQYLATNPPRFMVDMYGVTGDPATIIPFRAP